MTEVAVDKRENAFPELINDLFLMRCNNDRGAVGINLEKKISNFFG